MLLDDNIPTVKTKLLKLQQTAITSAKLLKLLWDFDKKIYLTNLSTSLVISIIPFANAYIYKLIIDLVVRSVNTNNFNLKSLIALITARIFTQIVQSTIYNLQEYTTDILWTKFPIHLYQKILSKISNLDLFHFENSDFKNKLEKVTNSYSWKPLNAISNVIYSIQGLLQVGISVVAIIYLNWYLAIPIVFAAIYRLWSQTRVAETSWGIWSDRSPYRKKYWYLSNLLEDPQVIKETKIFGLAPHFLQELTDLYKKFADDNSMLAKKEFSAKSLASIFDIITYLAIEVYVIYSAIKKYISIGEISYYTSIVTNFQNGVSGLFRNLTQVYENSLYVKEIFDLLDTKNTIIIPVNGHKINAKEAPLIEFRNVSFQYPGSKQFTLKSFNLTIKPGQKIALVGENGAGKSTIIKLLARFYDVTDGEILINGHNIKDIDLNSWHKALGVLFQDYIKYQHSFSDNIYFGRIHKPRKMSDIVRAAKMSGAHTVARKLDNGYDQMLGNTFEDSKELSVGQWQKVALSRGFLRSSGTLILDEPTAAIDAKAEYEIFKKVEKLSKNKTVVIISHRFSTVRNADTIYVLDKGQIIESGNHLELISKKGRYAKLFQLQARGYL